MNLLEHMTPAVAHERKDESVFLSFGNPYNGFHSQFDICGPIDVAVGIARAVNSHQPLITALEKADEELKSAGYRDTQWPRPEIARALSKAKGGDQS